MSVKDTLNRILDRILHRQNKDVHFFRQRSGKIIYLNGAQTLQGFADVLHDVDSYPAEVVKNSVMDDCSQLRGLMLAVKNPIDTGE